MANFGPQRLAEIDAVVWRTPVNFDGFTSWQRYCTASSSGRQPNFAALNRGRHLFGRATITLGIGPHSSLLCLMEFVHDHLTMGGATIMLGKLEA